MSIAAAQPLNTAPAPNARPKILVIDDEELMRELVTMHLRVAGYDVLVAQDAIAGGYLVLEENPDVVILDVHMPFMNGYELVSALKGDPTTRHIPIVFLTTDDDVEEHARKLGAEAYLKKPVTVTRLLETVGLWAPAQT